MADLNSIPSWISRLPRWLVVALVIPLLVLDGWAILLVLDYFRSIISPLILAAVLAFVLSFPVKFIQRYVASRTYAVLIIFLAALALIAGLTVTLVPLVLAQVNEFIVRLPHLLDLGSSQLQQLQAWAVARRLPINVNALTKQLETLTPEEVGSFSLQLQTVVFEAAGSLIEIVLVVALTLYLLLYGKPFWQSIFRWFPAPIAQELQQSLQDNFRNYFVGQAAISVMQGTSLSIALFILKVPLFLLFGMTIGLLVLIPFFDVLGVLAVSLIVAANNPLQGLGVFVVCLAIDQVLDNAVSPRIMGKLVGINPVWIILSLLIGVKIAGFVGIILAIPVASTIQDLIEYFYPSSADRSKEISAAPLEPTLNQL